MDRVEDKKTLNPDEPNILKNLIQKYFHDTDMFTYLKKNTTYVMQTPPIIRTNHVINIIEALFGKYKDQTLQADEIERFLVYAIAWSIGGLYETEEREKFHKWLESKGAPLPQITGQMMSVDKVTVFDYFVDEDTKQWKLWEAEKYVTPKRLSFSQLLIPTIDSTRAQYIISKIANLPNQKSKKRNEKGQ